MITTSNFTKKVCPKCGNTRSATALDEMGQCRPSCLAVTMGALYYRRVGSNELCLAMGKIQHGIPLADADVACLSGSELQSLICSNEAVFWSLVPPDTLTRWFQVGYTFGVQLFLQAPYGVLSGKVKTEIAAQHMTPHWAQWFLVNRPQYITPETYLKFRPALDNPFYGYEVSTHKRWGQLIYPIIDTPTKKLVSGAVGCSFAGVAYSPELFDQASAEAIVKVCHWALVRFHCFTAQAQQAIAGQLWTLKERPAQKMFVTLPLTDEQRVTLIGEMSGQDIIHTVLNYPVSPSESALMLDRLTDTELSRLYILRPSIVPEQYMQERRSHATASFPKMPRRKHGRLYNLVNVLRSQYPNRPRGWYKREAAKRLYDRVETLRSQDPNRQPGWYKREAARQLG